MKNGPIRSMGKRFADSAHHLVVVEDLWLIISSCFWSRNFLAWFVVLERCPRNESFFMMIAWNKNLSDAGSLLGLIKIRDFKNVLFEIPSSFRKLIKSVIAEHTRFVTAIELGGQYNFVESSPDFMSIVPINSELAKDLNIVRCGSDPLKIGILSSHWQKS